LRPFAVSVLEENPGRDVKRPLVGTTGAMRARATREED
jgi:hypothetical protein